MSDTLNPNMVDHLKRIHAAYGPAGYSFQNPAQPMTASLLRSGHLLHDPNTVDPSNTAKVAVVLSDAGHAAAGTGASPAAATATPSFQPTAPTAVTGFGNATLPVPSGPAAPVPPTVPGAKVKKARGPRVAPAIAAGTGFRFSAIPEAAKGARTAGVRPETYPFSTLAAPDNNGYDSFFVAATAEMPNPGKTMNGTVISANKRFKAKGVVFKLVSMDKDPEHGVKGARVLRIA